MPTPSNPGGLDPSKHMSIATALSHAGYVTDMSGKWQVGIMNCDDHEERRFSPVSHGYV